VSRNPHYTLARARSSLGFFAAGKVVTGGLGLLILLLIVRHLEPREFGLYVAFVAVLEVAVLVSSFGLMALVQRYVPDVRARGSARQLRGLLGGICLARLLTLAVACGVLAYAAVPMMGFLRLDGAVTLFRLYLVVVMIEGCARYLDQIFESLLTQGRGQLALVVRNGAKLAGILGVLGAGAGLGLEALIWVDITAAACGLVTALCLLGGYLRGQASDQAPAGHVYDRARVARFSLNSYLSLVLGQVYGLETLKLVVARTLGVLETATYGFAQSLADMLRRYLPAQLLQGVLRPLLVSRHAEGHDFAELNRLANLLFKINLFCLAPVVVFLMVFGAEFVALFTGGKYPEAHSLLVGMSLLLVLHALHIVLGLIALTLERGDASVAGTVAAASGLVIAVLLAKPYGTLGVLAGAYVSELAWCGTVWWKLRRAGWCFTLDLAGNARIILIAGAAGAVLVLVGGAPTSVAVLAACAGVSVIAFAAFGLLAKPFTSDERSLINRLLPRPVFVW